MDFSGVGGSITRREFVKGAAAVGFAAAGVAGGLRALAADQGAAAKNPFARLQKVSGDVFVNGEPGAEKQPLMAGDTVRTGKGGTAWVVIQGSAAVMVKQLSSVKISAAAGKKGEETDAGAALSITSGAALNYIHGAGKKGYPFSVKTPTAMAGVRGTTFFAEVIDEHRTYICDCYGNVEISSAESPEVSKSIKTDHHTAFMIGGAGLSGDELIQRAGMINHTDEEIAELKKIFQAATGVKPYRERQNPDPGGGSSDY